MAGDDALILLDTCALIWWTLEPEKLSADARRACDRIKDDGGFYCSISLWEMGIKIKKGSLDIGLSLSAYRKRLEQTGIESIAVDDEIWIESIALNWDHADPVDRTIVATARIRDLRIVTKDERISEFHKSIIW